MQDENTLPTTSENPDTAAVTGQVLVQGVLHASEAPDTASITGQVRRSSEAPDVAVITATVTP